MDILATRVLSYPEENGDKKVLVLIVFLPFQAEDWRCRFAFDPPIIRKDVDAAGVDYIQAFVECVTIARIFLENTHPFRQADCHGMFDCGLPAFGEKPASSVPPGLPRPEANPESMEVLTTRAVRYPDENGTERELLLTVFAPFGAENKIWKCGFTFGPPLNAPLRYGVGADFIEALLDCLAMARATFEGTA